MTKLRQRMIQDMPACGTGRQLRGMAERTQKSYVFAVRKLAEHFSKPPDRITEEELRDYFLYLKNVKKNSRTASNIALCGIKFFFTYTLKREWTTLKFVRLEKEKKLPVVLTRDEVKNILNNVKLDRHKICLKTIYSLGLRLSEGTNLKIADIDSKRSFVHIKNAKGNKDRYIPLPKRTLELMRKFWLTHRNPVWLFPGPGRGAYHQIKMATSDKPMPRTSIQIEFRKAWRKAKINKPVSVHHLRHSYAVHLLEAAVNIRHLQQYLDHSDIRTTMVYTHLTKESLNDPADIINQIIDDL